MVSVRKQGETGIHHVMVHGTARCNLFHDDADCKRYLSELKKRMRENKVEMLAWCLMGNHVHLLPKADKMQQISNMMRDVNATYAAYFNQKYERSGHLMQGVFASKPVDDEPYLMTVVRYIHQNPIGKFSSSCDYRWSSYQEYVGKYGSVIASTDLVLGAFGSLDEFVRFHEQIVDEDGSLDPNAQARKSNDEAHAIACAIAREAVGCNDPKELKRLPRESRDNALFKLRKLGLTIRQIVEETGISVGTVSNASRRV